MSMYPCIDENRHYKSYPCSLCTAPNCLFGRKPASRVQLLPDERRCATCDSPFKASGRSKYCSYDCRLQAMYKRRKSKRTADPISIYP